MSERSPRAGTIVGFLRLFPVAWLIVAGLVTLGEAVSVMTSPVMQRYGYARVGGMIGGVGLGLVAIGGALRKRWRVGYWLAVLAIGSVSAGMVDVAFNAPPSSQWQAVAVVASGVAAFVILLLVPRRDDRPPRFARSVPDDRHEARRRPHSNV